MTTTTIFEHLIAIYAVVAAPWLAVRKMRQVRADGTAGSKIRLYRRAIFMQFLTVAAVLALCMFGAIPMANLGLCLPRSWPLSLVLGGVIISYFAYTAIRLRPKAEKFREQMRGPVYLRGIKAEVHAKPLRMPATVSGEYGEKLRSLRHESR